MKFDLRVVPAEAVVTPTMFKKTANNGARVWALSVLLDPQPKEYDIMHLNTVLATPIKPPTFDSLVQYLDQYPEGELQASLEQLLDPAARDAAFLRTGWLQTFSTVTVEMLTEAIIEHHHQQVPVEFLEMVPDLVKETEKCGFSLSGMMPWKTVEVFRRAKPSLSVDDIFRHIDAEGGALLRKVFRKVFPDCPLGDEELTDETMRKHLQCVCSYAHKRTDHGTPGRTTLKKKQTVPPENQPAPKCSKEQ